MKAKSIRTAMAAALAAAAIAASCAGAGGTAAPNQAAGRMDAPVAGARVGFALTMAKRNGSTFSAAHMPCFNPRHRHAPGGGTAVIDGYRDYVRKVHEDNPGFILSSETPSESYLDLFEAFILPHPSWELPHFRVFRVFRGSKPLWGHSPQVILVCSINGKNN